MARNLFHSLDEKKKDRIIKAALCEFARYSYFESSTNRIIKSADISKGSLFKYFTNKEELYFDVLDIVIQKFINIIKKNIDKLPDDLFEKVIIWSEMEFSWYVENPACYRLFKNAFTKTSVMYEKSIKKYGDEAAIMFNMIFKDIDYTDEDKVKQLHIIKWFLEGFNNEFINNYNIEEDIETVKSAYKTEIKEYIKILKAGI